MAHQSNVNYFQLMRNRLIPGFFPKLKIPAPEHTNKFRKRYREKVEATESNFTRAAPFTRLDQKHPWVSRHVSKRYWVLTLSVIAGVELLTIGVAQLVNQ